MTITKQLWTGLFIFSVFVSLAGCGVSPPPMAAPGTLPTERLESNKLLLLITNNSNDSHQAFIDEIDELLSSHFVQDDTINALALNIPLDAEQETYNLEAVVEIYASEQRLRLAADEVVEHFAERAQVDAYLASQYIPKPYVNKNWADGTPSPGLRFMTPMYRSEGWSRKQMETYWHRVHVPLAMQTGDAIFRYSTTMVQERLTDHSPDFDAMVGLHFESQQHQDARFSGFDGFKKGLKSRLDGFNFQNIFKVSPEDMQEIILKSGSMRK